MAVFQAVEVDVFFLDPFGQFPRGDTDIGIADFRFIPEQAGSAQLRTADFRFLRRTRRNADVDDFLGIDIFLLGKIRLDDRAQDTDRALRRRQMRDEVRIERFRKFDPGRAAAGELRDRNFFRLQTVQELHRFFHDGHIGTKVGIKDVVCTESAKGRYHFSFDEAARFHAKGFPEADADGRSRLKNNDFIRIVQGFLDPADVIDFVNGIKGAGCRTLAAMNTNRQIAGTGQGVIVEYGLRVGTGSAA